MSGARWRWLVLLGACGGLFLGVTGPELERGQEGGAYSTWEADTSGALGLWSLTRALGYRTERWSEPLAFLPGGGALVALCGARRPVRGWSPYERRRIEEWVREGGRLWWAGCDPEGLFGLVLDRVPGPCPEGPSLSTGAWTGGSEDDGEGVTTVLRGAGCDPAGAHVVSIEAGVDRWQGLGAFGVLSPAFVEERAPLEEGTYQIGAVHVLAHAVGGERFAVRRRVGRGEVWLLGSAEPFLNGAMRRGDGAVRFGRWLRTLPRGSIVRFDGWRIGEGSAPSAFGWLAARGAWSFWLPLVVSLGAWLWRRGTLLGPPRPPPDVPEDATEGLLDALQSAYVRSADARGMAERLRRAALREVARHWQLREASAEALSAALRRRGLQEEADAVARIGAAPPPPWRDEAWEMWVCSLERDVAASMRSGLHPIRHAG